MKANSTNPYRSLCVKLPERVKARLAEEAAQQGMSVNDFAGSLLSERFGGDFPMSGRRCSRAAGAASPFVVLRLPGELLEKIRTVAFEERTNMTCVVSVALADALGVTVRVESRRSFPLGGGRRLIE